MAVRFDNSADRLLRTSGLPSYDANYTVAFWIYLSSALSDNQYAALWSLNGGLYNTPYDWLGLQRTGGTTRLLLACATTGGNGYNEVAGGSLTTGTWYHVALVRSANNARTVYLNGTSVATLTASYSSRGSPTRMELGAFGTNNEDPYNGRIEGVEIWTAALSGAEVAAEDDYLSPTRTSDVHLWTPLEVHTDLTDQSGNGRGWTAGGTLTTETGSGTPLSPGGGATAATATAAAGVATTSAVGSATAAATATAAAGAATAATLSTGGVSAATATPAAGAATASATGGSIAAATATPAAGVATADINQAQGALRLYGTATGGIDRVRFPLTSGGGSTATPINVGAGSWTYDMWVKCLYADNATTATDVRYSNIVLDRDVWDDSRGHVPLGLTRRDGALVVIFGAAANSWASIRGTTNVGDGRWHLISVERDGSTVRIYVDGVVDASGTYSTASWAYPTSYTPTGGSDNAYLVLGAEKHDYVPGEGGYRGLVDELRISNVARYGGSPFTPPSGPYSPDGSTVGLYHLDSGSGTTAVDSATVSGAPTAGELRVGGANDGPTWSADHAFGTVAASLTPAAGVATTSAQGAARAAASPSAAAGAAAAVAQGGSLAAAGAGAAAGSATASAQGAALAASSPTAAAGAALASAQGGSVAAATLTPAAGVAEASATGSGLAEGAAAALPAAGVATTGATGAALAASSLAPAQGVAAASATGASLAAAALAPAAGAATAATLAGEALSDAGTSLVPAAGLATGHPLAGASIAAAQALPAQGVAAALPLAAANATSLARGRVRLVATPAPPRLIPTATPPRILATPA